MLEADISTRLDATWGDPKTWVANGQQWMHLAEIRSLINYRVTGDPSISRLAWLGQYLADAGCMPVRRALVLGCGAGHLERELHELGWVDEIVAFDLSPKVLEVARGNASEIKSIKYVVANMNDLPIGQDPFLQGSFDLVLGVSSVHHCAQLANLYSAVGQLLTPKGWFYMDEYVGPDQFQYTKKHMQQLRTIANLLPDRLLTTQSGAVKKGFRAPTVAEVVAIDPTEAVCSSSILSLLPQYFTIIAKRNYGSSLLHVLLSDVAQNFQAADAKPWLQALLDIEADLDRINQLEHHFSCVIARQHVKSHESASA